MEIILIVVLLALVLGKHLWDASARSDALTGAAARLGIAQAKKALGDLGSLQGEYRGREITVAVRTEKIFMGRRNKTIYFTVVTVPLQAALLRELSLHRRRVEGSVGDYLGLAAPERLQGSFDEVFTLTSPCGPELQEVLSRREVQRELRGLSDSFDGFRVEVGRVSAELKGPINDAEKIVRFVNRVIQGVTALEKLVDDDLARGEAAQGAPAAPAMAESIW